MAVPTDLNSFPWRRPRRIARVPYRTGDEQQAADYADEGTGVEHGGGACAHGAAREREAHRAGRTEIGEIEVLHHAVRRDAETEQAGDSRRSPAELDGANRSRAAPSAAPMTSRTGAKVVRSHSVYALLEL